MLRFSELEIEKVVTGIFPWEINCLLTISIFTNSWKNDKYTIKDIKRDINSLRSIIPNELKKEIAKWFSIVVSEQQFEYQNNIYLLMFRCLYYFNFCDEEINMKTIFKRKFNCDYYNFCLYLSIVSILSIVCEELSMIDKEIIDTINNYFGNVFNNLTVNIEELEEDYKNLKLSKIDSYNQYSPLIQTPVIIDGEDMIISYHNFVLACSTSLIYRVTLNNNELRQLIGKNVFESYLFYITSLNPAFKKVIKEIKYANGQLSPDVMATDGEIILLVDSKSYSSKIKLREFNTSIYFEEINKIAEYLAQLYDHCHNKYGKDYDCLNVEITNNRENIYGLVVVQRNPYFNNEKLYQIVS